jgi:glucose-6-phosphate isomerase
VSKASERWREARGALFSASRTAVVGAALIAEIKRRARRAPARRFRICLHRSTAEPVQDMLIAFCRNSYSPPHRHPGRSVAFQVIQGAMTFVVFDGRGRPRKRLELEPPGGRRPFCLRLAPDTWYLPLSRAPLSVFRETLAGSNQGGEANEYAAWAPREGNPAAAQAFLRSLNVRLRR